MTRFESRLADLVMEEIRLQMNQRYMPTQVTMSHSIYNILVQKIVEQGNVIDLPDLPIRSVFGLEIILIEDDFVLEVR